MTNDQIKLLKRLMRFGVTGGLTSIIYFSLIYVLIGLWSMNPTLASLVSFIPAIVYNYVSHKYWSFESDLSHKASLPRFAVVTISGMGINSGIIYLGTEMMGAPFLPVQAVAIAALLVWNYMMFSLWVFSD